jgi:glyoxylase-like metal-dependent hydrolase (beta-lactamase superfamily II)
LSGSVLSERPPHLPPLDLGNGICRIDTGLNRPGLAACYLVESEGRAAFIDCGTWHSVPHMLEVLESRSLSRDDVDYVIPTHIHLDHAGGAGELLRQLPNAKLVVHPFGAKHLIDPQRISQGAIGVYGEELFREHYHEIVPVTPERVIEAPDGFAVDLNGRRLEFVDTPGHAGHHFCVWDAQTAGFFTGDTFGLSYRETDLDGRALIFPTTTPVQFKPETWQESLDKLERFEPQAMYLTHFGRVTEVGRLMADLREGLKVHHEVALNTMDAEHPEAEIAARLTQWFLARCRAHGLDWSAQKVAEFFELDLGLNTQGLIAWQQRQG